jgi:hypothetical protein
LIGACGLVPAAPPPRFPQFEEQAVTSLGEYLLPQWSPDGRYLAFIDASAGNNELVVHDTHEDKRWVVARQVSSTHFDWDPEGRALIQKVVPSQVIPSGDVTYPTPAIGDSPNFGWVGSNRWVLAIANTPAGECYNYSLFFFDLDNLANSFCIYQQSGGSCQKLRFRPT